MQKARYNFRNLEVWQLGMDFVKAVYRLTRKFPADERFGLTAQARRAAISVPLNIAEGSMRRSKAEFAHFIRFALGSLVEVITCLEIAKEQHYIDPKDLAAMDPLQETLYFKLIALDKSQRRPSPFTTSTFITHHTAQ